MIENSDANKNVLYLIIINNIMIIIFFFLVISRVGTTVVNLISAKRRPRPHDDKLTNKTINETRVRFRLLFVFVF